MALNLGYRAYASRLGSATSAVLNLKVLLYFLFLFYLWSSVNIRASTFFVDFGVLDPGWFDHMIDKLDVVLSYLLNLDGLVAMIVL